MYEFKALSIMIATVNETELLQRSVDIIKSTCKAEDIGEMIIVVCDKSTPENLATVEHIRQSVTEFPVVVYKQKKPFVGMAVREAIPLVRSSHMLTMAADCEMDVRAVSRMIEQAKRTPNVIVTTSRWIAGGGFRGYSPVKLAFNRVFQVMTRAVFQTKLTDLTNCYQICPTYIMKALRLEEEKKPIFLELNIKPIRLGIEMYEIPCRWYLRDDGNDAVSFFQCFEYVKTIARVRLERKKDMLL